MLLVFKLSLDFCFVWILPDVGLELCGLLTVCHHQHFQHDIPHTICSMCISVNNIYAFKRNSLYKCYTSPVPYIGKEVHGETSSRRELVAELTHLGHWFTPQLRICHTQISPLHLNSERVLLFRTKIFLIKVTSSSWKSSQIVVLSNSIHPAPPTHQKNALEDFSISRSPSYFKWSWKTPPLSTVTASIAGCLKGARSNQRKL